MVNAQQVQFRQFFQKRSTSRQFQSSKLQGKRGHQVKNAFVLFLMAVAGVLASGCMMPNRPAPLPSWAIHVDPPNFSQKMTLAQVKAQLIAELDEPDLPRNYLSAERIAATALPLIRNNNSLDAILLLSIASYRYHQLAIHAVAVGEMERKRHMHNRPQSAHNAYDDLIKSEYKTYNDLHFGDEMDLVFSLWEQDSGVMQKFEQGMAILSKTTESRFETKKEALLKEIQQARTPSWELIKHSKLGDAFLRRLTHDLAVEWHQWDALYCLSKMPYKKFNMVSLEKNLRFFDATLIRSIVPRMDAYRTEVVNALKSASPQTRSNAAVIMGIAGTQADVPLLEASLAVEKHAHVRASLQFALIKQGKKEQLPTLMQNINGICRKEAVCEHVIMLVQWSTDMVHKDLKEHVFVATLANAKNSVFSRFFAAIILGDLASHRPLSAGTVSPLLRASTSDNEHIAKWATRAIALSENIDRSQVLRLLGTNRATDALLARMVNVGKSSDVQLLAKMAKGFKSRSELGKQSLIAALSGIETNAAEKVLLDLYQAHRFYRVEIAGALVSRKSISKHTLRTLAASDDSAGAAVIQFSLGSFPNAISIIDQLSDSTDNGDKYWATYVARLAVDKRTRQALWQTARYVDARYYPGDASLRHEALRALMTIAIYEAHKTNAPQYATVKSVTNRKPD